MGAIDLSVPGWLAPLVVVALLLSLTLPLALIVFAFSEGRHRWRTRGALLAWVVAPFLQ